jgi:hypothetical protein
MRHTAVCEQHVSLPLPWVSGRLTFDIPRGLAHRHVQKPKCSGLHLGFEGLAAKLVIFRPRLRD